jgi:ABC-type multidrug transport system ATPase subunit
MDPNTRRLIWGMIEQLREEGKTIVLTTHHLEEAEALSNRIGILASG